MQVGPVAKDDGNQGIHSCVHEGPPKHPTPAAVADLQRRIEELSEAVKARDEFITIAAHELRNPMTPILGEIERLLIVASQPESQCAPSVSAALKRLGRAVQRYMQRADMLLDVSRITSGLLRLECVPLDLSSLLAEIIREAMPMAERARCALRVEIQDGITGIWDPLGLEQIFDNLLSNAVKYGAGRPIEIELTAADGMACLSVRDHGIGISPADQARIFGRFERAVTRRSHGGFGVGLWVVDRLATAMGGRIEVASEPNRGSTFTFMLPLMPPAGVGADR